MNYHTKHEALVKAFSRIINEVFTPNDLAEVNKRNDADGISSDVCHTHDFYDANEIMAQAFTEVFGHEPLLCEGDDDSNAKQIEFEVEIMNNAWDNAKQNHFKVAA